MPEAVFLGGSPSSNPSGDPLDYFQNFVSTTVTSTTRTFSSRTSTSLGLHCRQRYIVDTWSSLGYLTMEVVQLKPFLASPLNGDLAYIPHWSSPFELCWDMLSYVELLHLTLTCPKLHLLNHLLYPFVVNQHWNDATIPQKKKIFSEPKLYSETNKDGFPQKSSNIMFGWWFQIFVLIVTPN